MRPRRGGHQRRHRRELEGVFGVQLGQLRRDHGCEAMKQADLPRSSRGVDLASSLWAVAEDLTATTLPAKEFTPSR
jgi:hypothetical protein